MKLKYIFTFFVFFIFYGFCFAEDVIVFPNPYDSSIHSSSAIYFGNTSGRVNIKIYKITGEKIADMSADASGGRTEWNLKNDDGEDIASGVYLYLVEDSLGKKHKGKFAVIR